MKLIRLLKDILNRYPELDPIDIVGHVAEDTGFIDASGAEIPEEYVYTDHGPNYEINEKNNVANGGKREKGQVDLATSIHNKQKYNIEQKNK